MKLNLQMFGGRGAKSSLQPSSGPRKGLKGYFSKARENLKNVAFKVGNKDIITDSYSMFILDKTGLPYSKDKKLIENMKKFDKNVKDFENQITEYVDVNTFTASNKVVDYFGREAYDINGDYGVSAKYIKKAKTILGKDAKIGIAYKEVGFGSNTQQQPHIIMKNKKGEVAWILPVRKY